MPSFQLQIVSPERVEYQGEVQSLVAPGGQGYLGILANHAPLLSTLEDGHLTAREANGREHRYRVWGGGFLEVHDNQAVVLTRHIEADNVKI